MRYNRFHAALAALTTTFMLTLAAGFSPARAQRAEQIASTAGYVRYIGPSQCIESERRMTSYFWRDKHRDTARFAPTRDSLPRPVRDSLTLCAARFSASTVAPAQLLPLLQLSLMTLDLAKADAAAARLVASLPSLPVRERSRVLLGMVRAFMNGSPVQLTRARQYLAMLDAMAPGAAPERMLAHSGLGFYGWAIGDLVVADSESKAAIVASRGMSRTDQLDMVDSIVGAYGNRSAVVSVVNGSKAALAFMDTASALVVPMTQNGGPRAQYKQARTEQIFGYYRGLYTAIGTVANPVHADKWLGAKGDTVFPKPGRVTLAFIGYPNSLGFSTLAPLRRVLDEYKSRGVEAVYMTHTIGYFGASVNQPDEEMANWQRWFVDFMRVPIPIAVDEAQFGRLADGRRRDVKTSNETNYTYGGSAVIVGKDGKIMFVNDLMAMTEQIFRQRLETALAQ